MYYFTPQCFVKIKSVLKISYMSMTLGRLLCKFFVIIGVHDVEFRGSSLLPSSIIRSAYYVLAISPPTFQDFIIVHKNRKTSLLMKETCITK